MQPRTQTPPGAGFGHSAPVLGLRRETQINQATVPESTGSPARCGRDGGGDGGGSAGPPALCRPQAPHPPADPRAAAPPRSPASPAPPRSPPSPRAPAPRRAPGRAAAAGRSSRPRARGRSAADAADTPHGSHQGAGEGSAPPRANRRRGMGEGAELGHTWLRPSVPGCAPAGAMMGGCKCAAVAMGREGARPRRFAIGKAPGAGSIGTDLC